MPKGNSTATLLGEPVDRNVDVGAAVRRGEDVQVRLFSGTSALSPGGPTDKVEVIDRVLAIFIADWIGGLSVGWWVYVRV